MSIAALFNMVATNHMWPFKFKLDAATWMDLEIITLSEVKSGRERQISYDITDMWNLKTMIQMNLFTKQKQKTNL